VDTVPDQLTQATHGTRATKENGVVFELSHTVVVKYTTGGSIHVREWVLGLAVLCQDTGGLLVKAINESNSFVLFSGGRPLETSPVVRQRCPPLQLCLRQA